jgi:hypothetical protein
MSSVRKKLTILKSKKIYEKIALGLNEAKITNSLSPYDFSKYPKGKLQEFDHSSLEKAKNYILSASLNLGLQDNKVYVSFCSSEINANFWIELNGFSVKLLDNAISYLSSLEFVISDDKGVPVLVFLEDEYVYKVIVTAVPSDK